MKAVVAAFNQEKALVGAFSVITNPQMELFEPVSTEAPSAGAEVGTELASKFARVEELPRLATSSGEGI